MRDEKTIVGWRELVDFPEWGIRGIVAKIDTGARTSAIHVENIEELPGERIRFDVVLDPDDVSKNVTIEAADIVRVAKVRPSSGKGQKRHVVSTTVRLGPVEHEIEISLVSRRHMLCRMLVGRTALDGQFIVDPGRQYVLGRRKRSGSRSEGRRGK